MKEFLKKNWAVILVGCLSAFLGVLTLLTVVKLRRITPVAPTVPKKKPKAVIPACTLTFKLTLALSPTPTLTGAPTATPTATATPTPTSKPNDPPFCTGLSANPTSGKAPLKVTFTGNGTDRDGKITAFEFSFGDGEIKMVEKDVEGSASHVLDYTYSSSGTYWASLRVRDNNNVWSETPESCKVKIDAQEKVIGGGEVSPTPTEIAQAPTATEAPTATSTPIPVPEVPEAGIALPTILTILSGSFLILLGLLF